ncbi:MAG TPA: sodium:solute symporter family protein [bacterium]|nr:sodium:solute symporter family protein [bacterium]HNT66511.1 sodium:solute symporter family protein [bacterium]
MQSIDIFLIVLYLLSLVGIGLRKPKENSAANIESYLLDSRRLTLPAFVATLVSTWYGGILGVGEYSYLFGISNWLVFGVPYYLAALIFALFIAKRARRSQMLTIPQQLEHAYGQGPAHIGALLVFVMTVPAAYVLMLGVLIQFLTAWPLILCIALGSLFSMIYVTRGGFRAVVRTDLLQFGLMFAGFILLLFYAVNEHGGLSFLQQSLPATHFSWHGGNRASTIAVWYFIALSTLIEPAFYQRCFAAKNETVARNGILLSIAFWIVFDFLTTFSGLYARAILPELQDPISSYLHLAGRLLPPVSLGLFVLALLSTIMSTVDSYSFLAATTIGRDFLWSRSSRNPASVERYSKIGMVLTCVLSIAIAAWAQSVIRIWKDFGSIGTPALLLPLASSFSPRFKMTRTWVPSAILISGGVSTLWLVSRTLSGNSDYWLDIEPIYPGLLTSLLFFSLDKVVHRLHRHK